MLLSFGMMLKIINIILIIEIKEFSKSNEKGIIFTGCFDFENDFKEEKEETDRWIKKVEEERKRNGENRKV